MIHTARQSAKFIKFVRRLRTLFADLPVQVETIAVGILESLWHATATGAIRGDIGKFDDELIAEMVGWKGEASTLISILVECRWLDRHPEYRLVIHDWHDHAPRFVKGNVAKAGGFVSLFIAQGVALEEEPKGDALEEEPQRMGAPNLTKPNLTKQENPLNPPLGETKKKIKPKFDPFSITLPPELDHEPIRELWGEWVEHRREIGKPLTERAIRLQFKDLSEWGPQLARIAIETGIKNRYQGLFKPKPDMIDDSEISPVATDEQLAAYSGQSGIPGLMGERTKKYKHDNGDAYSA